LEARLYSNVFNLAQDFTPSLASKSFKSINFGYGFVSSKEQFQSTASLSRNDNIDLSLS